ncbi:FIG00823567: hypothetical protein [Olavius algarvensis associated proteobacterium Delta 3]|nr:FIG00823567: hypothetical protein [Olavius algarvensis associated proteobacterium Delta 3]
MAKAKDITVFISTRNATCDECSQELGRGAWITLDDKKNAYCLTCADLDHLVFLPAGDAALTRRSRKHSRLSAVVVKWSRARKRYERQGLLVENDALERAEEECAADEDARKRARELAAARRAELDVEYIRKFADRVRELYPDCLEGREHEIAEHACRKYSGRVGRSAAAKVFHANAVRLAVTAHVRHTETNYDDLLLQGVDRWEARDRVYSQVLRILDSWEHGK